MADLFHRQHRDADILKVVVGTYIGIGMSVNVEIDDGSSGGCGACHIDNMLWHILSTP
jgi:predicted NBD/HSP70 family sugar kinase